ncbi:MAG: hypothetical protein ABL999_11200 [Pyrinomonadaceae bacterium]
MRKNVENGEGILTAITWIVAEFLGTVSPKEVKKAPLPNWQIPLPNAGNRLTTAGGSLDQRG